MYKCQHHTFLSSQSSTCCLAVLPRVTKDLFWEEKPKLHTQLLSFLSDSATSRWNKTLETNGVDREMCARLPQNSGVPLQIAWAITDGAVSHFKWADFSPSSYIVHFIFKWLVKPWWIHVIKRPITSDDNEPVPSHLPDVYFFQYWSTVYEVLKKGMLI